MQLTPTQTVCSGTPAWRPWCRGSGSSSRWAPAGTWCLGRLGLPAEWMHEWMNEWMNEWINEWINLSMHEWMNRSMNEWMNEWINE